MAALNTSDRKDFFLHRGLFVITLGVFTGVLRGLTSLEEFSSGGLIARIAAVVTAAVLAKGFHVFWLYLARVLLGARTCQVKIGALVATIPPLLLVTGASAHLVATGLAGFAAQVVAERAAIAEYEDATASQYKAAVQLGGYVTDLNQMIGGIDADRKAEFERGALSGSAGHGAVHDVLGSISAQLLDLRTAIQRHQSDAEDILASAHKDLAAMREIAGKDLPATQRMKLLREKADKLRQKLSQLDVTALNASLIRTAKTLPGAVDALAFKLSTDSTVARNQREALARLKAQVAEVAQRLAALGEEVAALNVVKPGEFEVLTPMLAVAIYWKQFTTAWCIALVLDTLPLWWLLVLLIGASERTQEDELNDTLGNISLRTLLASKAARALLNTEVPDKAVKRMLASQLPQEDGK